MTSIELTFVIPVILGIIVLVLIASYFLAHLIDFELTESMAFLNEILNKPVLEKSNRSIKEEAYRSVDRFIFSPVRNNESQHGLVVNSVHHLSRIRKSWLLLSSIVYEGGIDYFNEEK